MWATRGLMCIVRQQVLLLLAILLLSSVSMADIICGLQSTRLTCNDRQQSGVAFCRHSESRLTLLLDCSQPEVSFAETDEPRILLDELVTASTSEAIHSVAQPAWTSLRQSGPSAPPLPQLRAPVLLSASGSGSTVSPMFSLLSAACIMTCCI